MASLFFPQMTSGALVQYPIQKTQSVRTVRNVLADGSDLVYADGRGSTVAWQLSYEELSLIDLTALQSFYAACYGPLRAFTFIDPTDNLLTCSNDLTKSAWNVPLSVQLSPNIGDPFGGSNAFTIINSGQAAQGVEQSLVIPANYQYCFSFYIRSAQGAAVSVTRGGKAVRETDNFEAASVWKRITSTGQLNDAGILFTASIGLGAGQQADIYGLQLDAQLAPSDYRPTAGRGGIYTNAHWGVDQLPVVATAFDQYATTFLIESSL